eukprot:16043-Pleurochrysis_carterae.AAC.1
MKYALRPQQEPDRNICGYHILPQPERCGDFCHPLRGSAPEPTQQTHAPAPQSLCPREPAAFGLARTSAAAAR